MSELIFISKIVYFLVGALVFCVGIADCIKRPRKYVIPSPVMAFIVALSWPAFAFLTAYYLRRMKFQKDRA